MSVKALPSMEHTFTLDVRGSDTGRQFQGTFTYKRPNIRLQSEIAKLECRLNEDLKSLNPDTRFLHGILAELRHTLTVFPDWWAKENYGIDLYDENVIFDIWRETSKFEREWREQVWGNQDVKTEEKKSE